MKIKPSPTQLYTRYYKIWQNKPSGREFISEFASRELAEKYVNERMNWGGVEIEECYLGDTMISCPSCEQKFKQSEMEEADADCLICRQCLFSESDNHPLTTAE